MASFSKLQERINLQQGIARQFVDPGLYEACHIFYSLRIIIIINNNTQANKDVRCEKGGTGGSTRYPSRQPVPYLSFFCRLLTDGKIPGSDPSCAVMGGETSSLSPPPFSPAFRPVLRNKPYRPSWPTVVAPVVSELLFSRRWRGMAQERERERERDEIRESRVRFVPLRAASQSAPCVER